MSYFDHHRRIAEINAAFKRGHEPTERRDERGGLIATGWACKSNPCAICAEMAAKLA